MKKIIIGLFTIIASGCSINNENPLGSTIEDSYVNESLIKLKPGDDKSKEKSTNRNVSIVNHDSTYGKGEYLQPNTRTSFLLKNTLVFNYKAKKGEKIFITVNNTSKNFFSLLKILDANGAIVAADNDENEDFISKTEYQATYEGDYLIDITPLNYSHDFNKTGTINIFIQNNLEEVVEDIPIHSLKKGNFYKISKLYENEYKKAIYKTKGYITKINNCFCPKGAYCKICSPSVTIAENKNGKKSIATSLGKFSPKDFTLNEKYNFMLIVENKSYTDEPQNYFIIDSFEIITK